MSKAILSFLHRSYQNALIAHCDNDKSVKALDRLVRVRQLQLRAAKHYGVAVMKGPRA